jgi:hypothetical protein
LPKIICNTSPFQYLHQAGQLELLPSLAGRVSIPPAVVMELAAGRALGLDLPSPESLPWVTVETPRSLPGLALVRDLGEGESQVLALALECQEPRAAILDDLLARQMAKRLDIPHVGTLGVLIQAKAAGLLPELSPVVVRLEALGFRLAARTRAEVLRMAGEG